MILRGILTGELKKRASKNIPINFSNLAKMHHDRIHLRENLSYRSHFTIGTFAVQKFTKDNLEIIEF